MLPSPTHSPTTLAAFNALPAAQAESILRSCCGSTHWAAQLTHHRPFPSRSALIQAADHLWHTLPPADWLEAFSHHPRIGDTNASAPNLAPTAALSQHEQSGMTTASQSTRAQLLELNHEYEHRFKHVFLICATGLSADTMLAELRRRLANDPATELRNAAAEQAKITRLRLEKLITT